MDPLHAEDTVRGLVERYTEDPPYGLDAAYVTSFADRHWGELVGMAEEAYELLEGRPRTTGFCPVCFYPHDLLDGRVAEHPSRSPSGTSFPEVLLGDVSTVCPGSSYPSYGESPTGSSDFLITIRAELENARKAFVASHKVAPKGDIARNAQLDVADLEKLERKYNDYVVEHGAFGPRYLKRERDLSYGIVEESDTSTDPCETGMIRASRVPYLTDKVTALNKKAKRLKMEPLVLTIDTDNPIIETEYDPEDEDRMYPHKVTYYNATLCGHRPKLQGWMLIAVLDHKAGPSTHQPLVYSFGYRIPPKWEAAGPYCEHCSSERKRNMTFLLLHDDGRLIQVGSTCLQDFLGGQSVAQMLAYASIMPKLRGFFGDDWDEDEGPEPAPSTLYLPIFLALASKSCREDGWHKRDSDRSTADGSFNAYMSLHGPARGQAAGDQRKTLRPEPEDEQRAADIITWARGDLARYARGDYETNLQRAMVGDYISTRAIGIVASATIAYHRNLERTGGATRDAEKAERALNKVDLPSMAAVKDTYPVKARMTFHVTLGRTLTTEGAWGVSTLHKFTDDKGTSMSWFASGYNRLAQGTIGYAGRVEREVQPGERVEVTATVKEIKEYKGRPDVVLSRVTATLIDPHGLSVKIKGRGKDVQQRRAQQALLAWGWMGAVVDSDIQAVDENDVEAVVFRKGDVTISVRVPFRPFHTHPIGRAFLVVDDGEELMYLFGEIPDNLADLVEGAADDPKSVRMVRKAIERKLDHEARRKAAVLLESTFVDEPARKNNYGPAKVQRPEYVGSELVNNRSLDASTEYIPEGSTMTERPMADENLRVFLGPGDRVTLMMMESRYGIPTVRVTTYDPAPQDLFDAIDVAMETPVTLE